MADVPVTFRGTFQSRHAEVAFVDVNRGSVFIPLGGTSYAVMIGDTKKRHISYAIKVLAGLSPPTPTLEDAIAVLQALEADFRPSDTADLSIYRATLFNTDPTRRELVHMDVSDIILTRSRGDVGVATLLPAGGD